MSSHTASSGNNGESHLLLIEPDRHVVDTFARALESLPLRSSWASSGVEGLAAARHTHFDLLFVELDLPDISGMDLVRMLRAERPASRVVVVTPLVSATVARHALQGGALAVLERPFKVNDLVALVSGALALRASRIERQSPPAGVSRSSADGMLAAAAPSPASVAERWAYLVLKTMDARSDPKTLGSWARTVGVSRSALCECCRLVHLTPHDARDFARLMRAICGSGEKWQPEMMLDLADARTLKKLLARAGIAPSVTVTPTIETFLESQRWIPAGNPGLCALRAIISPSGGMPTARLTM